MKDHEDKNCLIVVGSKQSNKFWVCTFKENMSDTLFIIGHDFWIEKDVNGEDIGEVDELGFVEMTPDSRCLLMCTTKLLVINIDI